MIVADDGRILDFDIVGRIENPSGKPSRRWIGPSLNEAVERLRQRRLSQLLRAAENDPGDVYAMHELARALREDTRG